MQAYWCGEFFPCSLGQESLWNGTILPGLTARSDGAGAAFELCLSRWACCVGRICRETSARTWGASMLNRECLNWFVKESKYVCWIADIWRARKVVPVRFCQSLPSGTHPKICQISFMMYTTGGFQSVAAILCLRPSFF